MNLNETIEHCLNVYETSENFKNANDHLKLAKMLMKLENHKVNESMRNILDKDYLIESKATIDDLENFAKSIKIDQWLKNYKTKIDMLKQSIRISRKDKQDTSSDKRMHDLNVTMNKVYKKFLDLLKTCTKPGKFFKDLKKSFDGLESELKIVKSLEDQFAFYLQEQK